MLFIVYVSVYTLRSRSGSYHCVFPPRQEISSAGSRFPPTLPPRSMYLSSSCSSPPASPSSPLTPRCAPTPWQRPILNYRIDTKCSDGRTLLTPQKEAAELQLLRQDEPLNVVVHAGGDGLANTYITLAKTGSCGDARDRDDITAKRW